MSLEGSDLLKMWIHQEKKPNRKLPESGFDPHLEREAITSLDLEGKKPPLEQIFTTVADWYQKQGEWNRTQAIAQELLTQAKASDYSAVIAKPDGSISLTFNEDEARQASKDGASTVFWGYENDMHDQERLEDLKQRSEKMTNNAEIFRNMSDAVLALKLNFIPRGYTWTGEADADEIKNLILNTVDLYDRLDKPANLRNNLLEPLHQAIMNMGDVNRSGVLNKIGMGAKEVQQFINTEFGIKLTSPFARKELQKNLDLCATTQIEEQAKKWGIKRNNMDFNKHTGLYRYENSADYEMDESVENPLFKKMSTSNPQEAVKIAFKILLGREPDELGKNHYETMIQVRGSREVVKDILRSTEHADYVVDSLFAQILGRKPKVDVITPNNEQLMYREMIKSGSNPLEVADKIRRTDEARQLFQLRKMLTK